jgi:hypothetical protein
VEIFTSGMDKDDAAGAEEDVVDDEGDDTETGDDFTVDKVEMVDAVDNFELAVVGVTDKTVTFADDGDDFVDVGNCFVDAEDDFTDVKMDEVQSPKPAWQPFPQYAEDEPQHPLSEQQFPNAEPLQVRVFLDCVPQRAAVLHLRASAPRNGRAAMANSRAECIVNEDGPNE